MTKLDDKGIKTTAFKSIVDTGIYTGNKTLRMVYSNKVDSEKGLIKDRVMKPKTGDTKSIASHLIAHQMDGCVPYSDNQFAFKQLSMPINLKSTTSVISEFEVLIGE